MPLIYKPNYPESKILKTVDHRSIKRSLFTLDAAECPVIRGIIRGFITIAFF
jgi:hypothetical protein